MISVMPRALSRSIHVLVAACLALGLVACSGSSGSSHVGLAVRAATVGNSGPIYMDVIGTVIKYTIPGSCRAWELAPSVGGNDDIVRILLKRSDLKAVKAALALYRAYKPTITTFSPTDLDKPPEPDPGYKQVEPMPCATRPHA